MKLYLASFLEPQNFGPSGKVIGVANGNKPFHVDVATRFQPFIPSDEILDQYYAERNSGAIGTAGDNFEKNYRQQLEDFYQQVVKVATEKQVEPQKVLPFADGDTLASWEREFNSHYRKTLAQVLEKLGYEVESH